MITVSKQGGQSVTQITELYGKSTDTKPIGQGIKNGSSFFEIDTGEVYI